MFIFERIIFIFLYKKSFCTIYYVFKELFFCNYRCIYTLVYSSSEFKINTLHTYFCRVETVLQSCYVTKSVPYQDEKELLIGNAWTARLRSASLKCEIFNWSLCKSEIKSKIQLILISQVLNYIRYTTWKIAQLRGLVT